MTADELKKLVREHGWRLEWSKRNRTRYAYAAKGSKPHVVRRYICGEYGLKEITIGQIVQKLQAEQSIITRTPLAIVVETLARGLSNQDSHVAIFWQCPL